jgi:RNA polymerase sigma-70 factor (ECF subfamily)
MALVMIMDGKSAPLSGADRLAYARCMTDRLEDSALMLRYQDGDTGAFEVLYRRHNDSLFRYLLRLSGDRQIAEDIFQEAWGKIIRSRSNYRPTAKFSTYLFRVAHNCFIDYIRRNRRHQQETSADPDLCPDPGSAPEQLVERHLARERLNIAITSLPDDQRDVFLLHEEGGFSIDEIAQVTGVNRETAKSRLRYAVAKLRASMSGAAPARQ